MSPSKVRSLARLYAGMTPSEVANHEDWVRRFKVEQAEAAAKKAEEDRQYAVELRAMSDLDAVRETLRVSCDESENDPERALQVLTLSGFVRGTILEAAYRAGFKQSGEGWNGEHRPEAVDDEQFIERMQTDLAELRDAA